MHNDVQASCFDCMRWALPLKAEPSVVQTFKTHQKSVTYQKNLVVYISVLYVSSENYSYKQMTGIRNAIPAWRNSISVDAAQHNLCNIDYERPVLKK